MKIDMNDLNFNEEDELKKFDESLNCVEHKEESSDFIFSQNFPSNNDTKLNNNNNLNNTNLYHILIIYLSKI